MSVEVDRGQYVLPLDQPIVALEVGRAFSGLSAKEKLYAHHISKASWTGGLITLLQTSKESGPIFVLLHKMFLADKPQEFKASALKAGFTEADVTALFVYTCGVFSNAGNYKGFGDTKIIPELEPDNLEELLKVSKVWSEIEPLWKQVKEPMYDLAPGKTCLGYPPQGCTTYLSKNCTPEDNKKVQNWLKTQKLECYNNRLFKTESNGQVTYEIRLASEERGDVLSEAPAGDGGHTTYRLTRGDYSPLLGAVARHLADAAAHAANDDQSAMLTAYCDSFRTGELEAHKRGSACWIRDRGPAVETYIGFVETYRDPAGVRGEFEGFVAAVDRETSRRFGALVGGAEALLPLLPWPRPFEKDRFLRPDFTSLDVVTFAGSGIPAGINIPNYDEIRQTQGFKNVSLGNVIPASYQMSKTPFLCQSDADLLQKYRVPSFEIQVGLHELLGHGSGKLFQRSADGSTNFPDSVVDPLTGLPVTKLYGPGDTYDSRFGPMSSAYEECRAEAVGLYLSLEPSVLAVFGHDGEEADNVVYVNWLSLVWAGAGRALEMYEPGRGWLQAHSQARYVLARVLIQAGVATITQPTEDDLLVTLDRSSLRGAARNAIGHFLLQLQVYKSTGDVEAAQKLFNRYSEVTEQWLKYRTIILANKQPRKIFVQANTVQNDNEVSLKEYEPTLDGMIQSWIDRFDNPRPLHQALLDLAKADAHHF